MEFVSHWTPQLRPRQCSPQPCSHSRPEEQTTFPATFRDTRHGQVIRAPAAASGSQDGAGAAGQRMQWPPEAANDPQLIATRTKGSWSPRHRKQNSAHNLNGQENGFSTRASSREAACADRLTTKTWGTARGPWAVRLCCLVPPGGWRFVTAAADNHGHLKKSSGLCPWSS